MISRRSPASVDRKRWGNDCNGSWAVREELVEEPILNTLELLDGDQIAWLYLQEEHARAIACSVFPATTFLPDEWIPLRGDPHEGWVVITKSRSKIGTMFHG